MNLPELATRRRVTIGMLTVTLVLFGLIGLTGLKVNLLPDLSYPTLTVRTDYEGAAPLEIENLISQPIEEAVGVVKNVRKVHSVSRTSQSDVVLEFAWGTDMDMASLEVRDGLKDGERVITIGRNAVRDGTEVTVLTPPPAQAQAAQVVATAPESGS